MRNRLSKALDFVCRKCSSFTSSAEDDGDVTIDGNVMEKMTKFSYLGDVLSCGGGMQEAVTARIRSEWKKFKDFACVLFKRFVSLKQ